MGREEYKEVITTALDTLALVAVAFGVSAGLWRWIGPFAVAVGGLLIYGAVEAYERWGSK